MIVITPVMRWWIWLMIIMDNWVLYYIRDSEGIVAAFTRPISLIINLFFSYKASATVRWWTTNDLFCALLEQRGGAYDRRSVPPIRNTYLRWLITPVASEAITAPQLVATKGNAVQSGNKPWPYSNFLLGLLRMQRWATRATEQAGKVGTKEIPPVLLKGRI